MADIPKHFKYTKDHEWADIDGELIKIGITDFAQQQMGDIVFVELPEIDSHIDQGASFGVIESIKSVSDLYLPIKGQIIEINQKLEEGPELLNSDPYESWIIKLKPDQIEDLDNLLNAEKYNEICVKKK